MMNFRLIANRLFMPLLPSMLKVTSAGLLVFFSVVMLIEMTYHLSLESAQGTIIQLFGAQIDTAQPSGWLIAAVGFSVGVVVFLRSRTSFMDAWDEANAEIERRIAGSGR
jgi:branched-chain amino acid transport system permease protein